jgi:hypothetical protein
VVTLRRLLATLLVEVLARREGLLGGATDAEEVDLARLERVRGDALLVLDESAADGTVEVGESRAEDGSREPDLTDPGAESVAGFSLEPSSCH